MPQDYLGRDADVASTDGPQTVTEFALQQGNIPEQDRENVQQVVDTERQAREQRQERAEDTGARGIQTE
jgi:hypothetical protein